MAAQTSQNDITTTSNKSKSLESLFQSVEKQFGKGTIMCLSEDGRGVQTIESISTGSISLDLALGIGGLPKGRVVEIYGTESSGKTTLTKLLLRFMDVTKGSITLGDVDLRQARQQDIRRCIAYVPQEPLLFHRSILDNIAYGNPKASRQMVIRAAKMGHVDEFANELPQGYDTLVGERGIKLSGGQRQRIAIARAIVKDAPILVLDEATSALDSQSEKLIQDALWDLMKERTAIVIAHRLSTIQKMDRIVVMDKGQIVQMGTHKQLLKDKQGIYAKLWSHQSGGYIVEDPSKIREYITNE